MGAHHHFVKRKCGFKDKATYFGIKNEERAILTKRVEAIERRLFHKTLDNDGFTGMAPSIQDDGGVW